MVFHVILAKKCCSTNFILHAPLHVEVVHPSCTSSCWGCSSVKVWRKSVRNYRRNFIHKNNSLLLCYREQERTKGHNSGRNYSSTNSFLHAYLQVKGVNVFRQFNQRIRRRCILKKCSPYVKVGRKCFKNSRSCFPCAICYIVTTKGHYSCKKSTQRIFLPLCTFTCCGCSFVKFWRNFKNWRWQRCNSIRLHLQMDWKTDKLKQYRKVKKECLLMFQCSPCL